MKYLFSVILLLIALQGRAQTEFLTIPISDDMRTNANSIIVNSKVDVEYTSYISGKSKILKIVKVLNSKGVNHGQFVEYTDEFRLLSKFKGEVYDVLGNSILKIKKNDLNMTEYSQHLTLGRAASYYYTPQIPTYPYYVVYEWELNFNDGIVSFPKFDPIDNYNQSCALASYTLIVPQFMGARFKECNIEGITKISYDDNNLILRSAASGIKAVNYEELMPPITGFIPQVYFGSNRFVFSGKKGEMSSWESYGRWSRALHEGRDVLSEPLKLKIHELTDTCQSDLSKVKALYDYLGENTRYVSIQLGIGGFQPMEAEKVHRLRLGDCKGLSFLLHSMLKEVNIKSVYTEIHSKRKRIMKDYPDLGQTNHVILQVPLPNDTLWLECTNSDIPFGYIHDDIAGHDAILITDQGGKFCTLPSYPDTLNRHSINCTVNILPSGEAKINVKESESLSNYESSMGFATQTTNKQIEILRRILNLNNSQITNITTLKDKKRIPVFYTNYEVSTTLYGKKTGNRLFIPVNIHRSKRNKYDYKTREHPIVLQGELMTDTITVTIPHGFVIESLPSNAQIKAPMGSFNAEYSVEQNVITIIQSQYLKGGEYPATENEAFSNLYNRSIKHFNDRIILRKEETLFSNDLN